MSIFSNRLAIRCEHLGFTQTKLAHVADLRPTTIYHYLHSNVHPLLNNFINLTYVLKVNADWLLGFEDLPSSRYVDNKHNFAAQFRSFYKHSGLKRAEIADRCGVEKHTINMWAYVRNQKSPEISVPMIAHISRALDTTPDRLLGVKREPIFQHSAEMKRLAAMMKVMSDIDDR